MEDGIEVTEDGAEFAGIADGVDFNDIYVDEQIRDGVDSVLQGKRFVQGPVVRRFESAFAEMCTTEHAVAVSSGTDAIYLALRASGVGPGDDVFVPGHTFFATASPVLALEANPVFVDINPTTYTMGAIDLEQKVSEADNPEAVLPVHVHGHPAEMHALPNIAKTHDMTLIEDARQAHGASYRDQPIGSYGDAGCFGFDPSKNMTVAGDGGMLVTDDDELAREARMLRNHGRDEDGVHRRLGLNHRMSEVAAAVGLEQLSHLPEWNQRRREAAQRYTERLSDIPSVQPPNERRDVDHVYNQYVIQLPDRDNVRSYLAAHDIETEVHYDTPVYLQSPVRERLDTVPTLSRSERLTDRVLSLPMHPRITDEEVDAVCRAIQAYVNS